MHSTHLNYIIKYINFACFKNKREKTRIMKTKLIEETPFTLVELKKGDNVIAIANSLISQKHFKNMKEAENYILSKPYELLVNLVFFAVDKAMNINNQEQKNEEEKK